MGFLTGLFRAATPENPRFSLNDPAAWDALGAVPSSAGVQVNEETALTHSPWWRGVNLLANDVAGLPLYVYKIAGDGKDQDKKHPSYPLLLYKPNEFQTAFEWKRQMMGHALARGNGYSYIFRNKGGVPIELLPLNPYDTYPVRENGKLWYVTRIHGNNLPDGGYEDRKLDGADVLHVKGFGFDGLQGYAVIDKAREVLGLGMGERKHQAIYFRNSAKPSVVLLHPGVLTDKVKSELRSSWERMQSGLENAHRTAVMDRGMTLKEISFNAADSQLLESRRFDLTDVANFLCIPSHKIGDKQGQAYNSLEQEERAYLASGLNPWLRQIEAECRDKLLMESEKDDESHTVGFDRTELMSVDMLALATFFKTALGGQPWMSKEEVRLRLGMNPEPDVGEIQAPLNMGPPGGEPDDPEGGGDKPPQPPAPPKNGPKPPVAPPAAPPKKPKKKASAARVALRAARVDVYTDAVRRMAARAGHQAERASKDASGWSAWVESFPAVNRTVFHEAINAAEYVATKGKPPLTAEWLLATLAKEYGELADRATAKTLAGECAGLAADQAGRLPREAARRYVGYSEDQPRKDNGEFGEGSGDKKDEDRSKFIGQKVGKAEHEHADGVSHEIARAVGGKTEEETDDPGQRDKKPYDVKIDHSDAIEVKSLLKGSKQSLSVHDDALLRKVDYAKAHPDEQFHTVAVDERATYEGGEHADSYSGNRMYYKRGCDRYSLSKMYPVKDEEELRSLISTPDHELPEKARGSLPSGKKEVAELREKAEKAHASRSAKDKDRKARMAAARKGKGPG